MRIESIVKIAIPVIAFGACATTTRGPDTPVSVVEPREGSSAEPLLAAVENPRLPDADRATAEIRDEAGDEASATVELCVAPDGHVDRVELKRRSTSVAYNRAVMKDVADWRFGGEQWAAPSKDACELATIKYDPQP
jgi:TonB family protein